MKTSIQPHSLTPKNIQLIGSELAIAWNTGEESYLNPNFLRAHSPSAENKGEQDIFGNQYGGRGPKAFQNITITKWQPVGNYALQIFFSDGHNTGLYSWSYLYKLSQEKQNT